MSGGLSGGPRRGMGPNSLSSTSPDVTMTVASRGRHSSPTIESSFNGRSFNKSRSIGNVLGHLFNKSKSTSSVRVPSRKNSAQGTDSKSGQSLNKSRSIGNVLGGQQMNASKTMGRLLNKSQSIGDVLGRQSMNKSKTMGGPHYKLSVDGRVPLPDFGRVSSAGSCRFGDRERPSSSSPRPFAFSSSSLLQPSPLYLSQGSLNSQTSQSSITSQVLEIAEAMGICASLEYLLEDAKKLHKKLLALDQVTCLDEIGISDEVGSVGSEGMDRRASKQAWREKSMSPSECVCRAESDPKGEPVPRPSVGALVDELTEVEQQIRGGRTESISTNDGSSSGSGKRNITASTATLELDELMQNLSKFEASNQGQGADGGKKDSAQKGKSAMDNLSSMLSSLDQDMTTRHGVSTVAKGTCAACSKPILNKVVKALGKHWHPEHFTCACCDTELGSTTYYESNGKPYCEKDYNELYAPRCAYCNGPILDRVMRALERTWHPEHFFCSLCGKHFGTEGFHQKDGKAFCRECYYEKYAPRCRRCDKAIMEGFITAINAQWHPECFSCKACGVTFPRGNYFEHEGEPHCELHYHASRGTLCNSCQKPVTGKCITAMGKKWHPEHFNCAFCLKLLNKGTFKEHRQNPYCHPCYIKLFG